MLTELIQRLEQGAGADRTLDGDIALALGLPQAYFDGFDTDDDGRTPFAGFKHVDGPGCFFGEPQWAGGGRSWIAPAFTDSLDAVISIMSQKLPGWVWLKRSPFVMGIYKQSDDDDVWAEHCEARAPSDSRALMAAVLRTLARG